MTQTLDATTTSADAPSRPSTGSFGRAESIDRAGTALLSDPASIGAGACRSEATIAAVGGPASGAWREDTLTRAEELQVLTAWVLANRDAVAPHDLPLLTGIDHHLDAARGGATARPGGGRRSGSEIQRATGNLHAAEAHLLNLAPADYLLGQLPSILNHVQRHLAPSDPRRKQVERIAQRVGVKDGDHPLVSARQLTLAEREKVINAERGKIVTAARGASTAALREQLRVRSFRRVLLFAAALLAALAVSLGIWAYYHPTVIPLCFQPETPGETVVVCVTAETRRPNPSDRAHADPDRLIAKTATPYDTAVVESIGLIAAALAAAAALRGVRGSSESMHLPVALALLKLPTGALTAYLGLALMRGQFVPGLSALDTPGQLIAWAAVFGYAQQLFTRLVDQQAHSVLDGVRGADKAAAPAKR